MVSCRKKYSSYAHLNDADYDFQGIGMLIDQQQTASEIVVTPAKSNRSWFDQIICPVIQTF